MQALLHRHIAMADDSPPQEIAAPGAEGALAGVFAVEGLYNEILGVDVPGVGGQPGHCLGGVLIGAQEVPHVAQQAEVGVPHRCVELLHPL